MYLRRIKLSRSEPSMNNGAIFVQRNAPPFHARDENYVTGFSCFLTKITPCFRTGDQTGGGLNLTFVNYSAILCPAVSFALSACCIAFFCSSGKRAFFNRTVGVPSVLTGICALSYQYDRPFHRTSGFRMYCPFSMPPTTLILI